MWVCSIQGGELFIGFWDRGARTGNTPVAPVKVLGNARSWKTPATTAVGVCHVWIWQTPAIIATVFNGRVRAIVAGHILFTIAITTVRHHPAINSPKYLQLRGTSAQMIGYLHMIARITILPRMPHLFLGKRGFWSYHARWCVMDLFYGLQKTTDPELGLVNHYPSKWCDRKFM